MSIEKLPLSFMGLNFDVLCDNSLDTQWLKDFFGGAFQFSHDEKDSKNVFRVSLSCDSLAVAEARLMAAESRQSAVAFILDSAVERLPKWVGADGTIRAYSDFYDVLYIKDEQVRVVEDSSPGVAGRRARGGLMRAIREQAMDYVWRRGSSILHGAAFVEGGKAVIIAGDKRAGKTSLLCAVLSLLPDSGFLANDRIALSSHGGELIARPVPTIISLRAGSLEVVPGLAARTAAIVSDYNGTPLPTHQNLQRMAMTTAQFASIMESTVCASAPVRSIVFPLIDPGQETFSLRKLDSEQSQRRILNAVFARDHLGAQTEFFANSRFGTYPSSEVILSRLDKATKDITCFELRMGPRLYTRPEIERFVESVAA
jgi:hypothetical protein